MPTPARPAIAWSWRNAGLGLAYAVPTVAVTVASPQGGLAWAVGVLPAAALGLPGRRRARVVVVVVGALAGLSMLLGSLVAGTPVLAVATVLALAVAVAQTTANPRRRLAPLTLGLGLPLVGAGLSEDPASGAGAALLILTGSVYAWLVSLLWPQGVTRARAPRTVPARSAMLRYGLQIGVAGAAGAAIGFAAGFDHPGWACTAALLVSRPDAGALHTRSVGRAVSVLLGALVACGLGAAHPANGVVAALAALALVGACATVGSRWYVTPFFSTTIVLSMLVARGDEGTGHWFVERVGETLIGIALALLAAWTTSLVPRRRATATPP